MFKLELYTLTWIYVWTNLTISYRYFQFDVWKHLGPCLEVTKKVYEVVQNSQASVIFQKSDPPEAAPLLAPCSKVTKKYRKLSKFSSMCHFQKSDPPEAAPLLAPCLKVMKKYRKLSNFSSRHHFSKIWPAGGSPPAIPMLENHKTA